MYIQPTGKICLLHGVPINKDYEHTIYFPTKSDQAAYFLSKTKYAFNNQSYTRTGRGSVRVEVKPELIYDCNYIMFENYFFLDNTTFIPEANKKWFYAFITHIEYVNNEVSEVFFEIDVMQSWLHDYTLQQCFVERQHTASDALFSNLVKEPLDFGQVYVQYDGEVSQQYNHMGIMVMASEYYSIGEGGWRPSTESTVYDAGATVIEHVYNGLWVNFYDWDDTTSPINTQATDNYHGQREFKEMLSRYQRDGKEQSIIAIYMFPWNSTDAGQTMPPINDTLTVSLPNYDMGGGAGQLHNNKIFTAPFSYIQVTNNNGATHEYQWENWLDTAHLGEFWFKGCMVNTPVVLCLPGHYNGIIYDVDEGIVLDAFPRCAWVGDAFKAFWAQNGPRMATGLAGAILGAGLGFAGLPSLPLNPSGIDSSTEAGASLYQRMQNNLDIAKYNRMLGVGGIALNLANTAGDIVTAYARSKHLPNRAYGDTSSTYLPAAQLLLKFSFHRMGLRADIMKKVDRYFDRYGYAIMETTTPSRNSRPYYTYVKTIGCTIDAHCPEDDAEAIEKIFDNGITFWNYRNGSVDVGNYNVDNRPT